jgi:predicted GH43/DUF377 family glycosyl hydrolase
MRRRAAAGILCALAACACGRYRDFTLPSPGEAPPGELALSWEIHPGPVLGRGAPGDFDAVDVLNPAVVRHEGVYYNLYSGFDGARWHTGLATSPDGIRWTKHGRVLSPEAGTWEGDYIAANGAVEVVDGEFYYWYQAGEPPRIGLARSPDAKRWRKLPEPVLDVGPRGAWDERGVADPYVIRIGGKFYLYFLGQDRAGRQRLGVAESRDGIRWWKLRSNPVLELGDRGAFDENGLGEPAVWHAAGRYWMLYTGRDRKEIRRIGLAVSRDGVAWRRLGPETVLAGNEPWNAKVVCDPSVEVTSEGVRVWYGGGDVAHPAENIHGQIGLACLRIRGVTLTK